MIQSKNRVQMSDAVATFYSQPSGQQRGGGKGLGLLKKFAIPLWRNVKDKLCEKIPSVVGKLCDSQESKISQGIRQMGERQIEEPAGGMISATRPAKRRLPPKKKRKRVKKIRFTSDDEDNDEPASRAAKKHKRAR